MATVTKFANANTVVTTGWTSPTNAYADDASYATCAPAKNADVTSDYGFPAFTTSDIPAGSTINSVTIEIVYKSSTTGSTGALIGLRGNDNGTLLAETTFGMNTADQTVTVQYLSGISLSDLQTANFLKARVRGHRGSSNTAITWSLDYVKVTVDYTLGPITLSVGKVASAEAVRGADVSVGAAPLPIGKISRSYGTGTYGSGLYGGDPTVVYGASVSLVTGGGSQTLSPGAVPSSEQVRGADLTPSTVTIAIGKVPSAAATRGADVSASGSATLQAGKVASGAVAQGADLAPGTATLLVGKIVAGAVTRGADLTPGPVTLLVGKVASSEQIAGADLSPGPVTLSAGKIASAEQVQGVNIVPAGSLLIGKVSSAAQVRGADLAPGSVTLSVGKVSTSTVVRGANATPSGTAQISAGKVSRSYGTGTYGSGQYGGDPSVVYGVTLQLSLNILAVGKVPSSEQVRGVDVSAGLTPGKISSSSVVRGVTLSGTGSASLSVGRVESSATVYGALIRIRLSTESTDTLTLSPESANTLSLGAESTNSLSLSSEATGSLSLVPEPTDVLTLNSE